MQRREFIITLLGIAAAWPLDGWAQLPRVPIVGILVTVPAASLKISIPAFHEGLKETGFIEGQNVAIEYRWAEGNYNRLPALAADLVSRKVDVIVTIFGVPAALAAKAATTTIPVVFMIGGDPVELGLVATLGRPGGNATGYTGLAQVGGKQWEVLFEMVPTAAKMGHGFLANPTHPTTERFVRYLLSEANKRGDRLIVANASTESEFDGAFALLAQQGARGLVIMDEPFFDVNLDKLAALATRHAIPAIAGFRQFATAGGLVSYGVGGARSEPFRFVGVYAGRILKGEKPSELPVQQPTKLELVINLKAAKALGITIPPSLLARADELIE